MGKLKKLWRIFFPAIQTKRVKPWFAADGDNSLRLNYEYLTSQSIVVDLGGYKGQWASDIYAKYKPKVLVFEPAKNFWKFIKDRFRHNSSIEVYPYALGDKDSKETIYLDADGSSTIKKKGEAEEVIFRRFDVMMQELNVQAIDLLKINIEGGEYDLLDYIISTGWVRRIKNIQVQFHDFVPDAIARMNKIQNALSKTHQLTYQFEFVWENWQLVQ